MKYTLSIAAFALFIAATINEQVANGLVIALCLLAFIRIFTGGIEIENDTD